MTLATIETTAAGAGEQPGQTAEEARATLERVEGQQAEWQAKRDDLVRQLEEKRAGAAGAALAGTATAKLAGEMARLGDEIAVVDGVLAQLAVNHLAARRAVQVANIEDQRRALAALEAEIAERVARNQQLAVPLFEYELGHPADGQWLPPHGITAGMIQRAEHLRHWIADLEGRLERGGES